MTEDLARALDERERAAFLSRDLDALSEILADDYVVTPYDNVPRDKSTVLELIEQGRIGLTEMHRTVEHVLARERLFVTFGSETVVHAAGQAYAGRRQNRRYTHVWVSDGQAWRLLTRHATIVDEAGEAG